MIGCPQTPPPIDALPLPVELVPMIERGPPEAAAWVWLAIVTILIVFELWVTFKPPKTLSTWLRKWTKRFWWMKWLGISAFAFLIYHLFLAIRAVWRF